ncbi:MAG: hypothetical protein ACTSPI_14085 [Candidatus Heimdallarchaeaceae archaeon]
MGRPRKKPTTKEVVKEETEAIKTVEVEKPAAKVVKEVSFKVKKLIRNPMKLSLSIVLRDFEPYTLTTAQLNDEIFMEHIKKLISIKKIERV